MKSIPFLLSLLAIPALAQITAWKNPNNPADIRLAKPDRVPVVDGVSRPWVQVTATNQTHVIKIPRPQFTSETNLIARASAALEQIAPNRPGVQTLMMIRQMPPERFIDLAKARLASATPERKAEIVAAALEVTALLKEAETKNIDWRSPEFGAPMALVTNSTLRAVER